MDIIISETERTELFIVLIVHILALREVKLCVSLNNIDTVSLSLSLDLYQHLVTSQI